MPPKKSIVIKAHQLHDGLRDRSDYYITIEGKHIADVSTKKKRADYEGYVTPAFIDAHSHIGMFRSGEPGSESEGNDHIEQISPNTDPLNSIYFDDKAFTDAVDFGVLYSCIMPGSGNLFGGRSTIIRNFVKNVDRAKLRDYGYKMALGFNPRNTTSWKGPRPNTRMGIYNMLEKHFDAVLAKKSKADLTLEKGIYDLQAKLKKKEISQKEFDKRKSFLDRERDLSLSSEDKVTLDALSGLKPIKVHVHKEDDVIYLLHLQKKYGLKVTAEHTCDVHSKRIFNLLAKNDIPIVYGPVGSLAYKVELKNESYKNIQHLVDSNAFYGLMTDHPVVCVQHLRDSLQYFLRCGVSPTAALSIITYNNAVILGIDDILGSVEPGKLASLCVWNGDPLHLASYPTTIIGEGQVLKR